MYLSLKCHLQFSAHGRAQTNLIIYNVIYTCSLSVSISALVLKFRGIAWKQHTVVFVCVCGEGGGGGDRENTQVCYST